MSDDLTKHPSTRQNEKCQSTHPLKKGLACLAVAAAALGTNQALAAETAPTCPDFLNQEYRQLHSENTVNLCSKFSGKPLLVVNTASHCGFTKQFGGLESLYKKYKDQGFEIVGFASNDFNQEDKSEEKAAGICYKNYGVTFTMLAPTSVRGDQANPTFQHLSKNSEAPKWNFNKYLISQDGKKITHFGSMTAPLDSDLEKALVEELKL